MKALQIDDLTVSQGEPMHRLAAVARVGRDSRTLFFQTEHAPIANSGDPFVPAVLLPAMRLKADLDVHVPVTEAVLRAAERIQQIKAAWHPAWRIASVSAKRIDGEPRRPSGGRIGAFFSGGVDSFYTIQRHRDEITHLIFVAGFDVPLRRSSARELITDKLRRTAADIGIPLLEVETNLREFSDGLSFSWEDQHGAALAAVAHLLAPGFDKIYIPSSYALPFVFPYGSHPGLDPLWSTPHLELVHDGIKATRADKIAALSSWDTAVRNLRVCWNLVEGQYNCCRCFKCLWTMAMLRTHGALDRAETFPLPLDLRKLSEEPPHYTEHRHRFIQAIALLEARGDDPELAEALRKALSQGFSLQRSLHASFRRLRRSVLGRLRRVVRAYRNLRASSRRRPSAS